jgi:hypothetical protein
MRTQSRQQTQFIQSRRAQIIYQPTDIGHQRLRLRFNLRQESLIRYGQLTHDEYFISESAASQGVKITNASATDPIVMLKHFGPENPDLVL